MEPILKRWQELTARIAAQRLASPLAADATTLIAVSKGQAEEAIVSLLEAGHRVFGENRVQEAQEKWTGLRERYPDIELHLIGTLQTNKIKEALQLFDAIHTIDRARAVDAIVKRHPSEMRARKFFIQVNTGEEEQKGGAAPDHLAPLLAHCRAQGLPVTGLMCVPPVGALPAPHFAWLSGQARKEGLAELSMGMSEDFETAIRFGATYVRIGTALFGSRDYPYDI